MMERSHSKKRKTIKWKTRGFREFWGIFWSENSCSFLYVETLFFRKGGKFEFPSICHIWYHKNIVEFVSTNSELQKSSSLSPSLCQEVRRLRLRLSWTCFLYFLIGEYSELCICYICVNRFPISCIWQTAPLSDPVVAVSPSAD